MLTMDKNIKDLLINGKVGTTELAEFTGDSRGMVRVILARVVIAIGLKLSDITGVRTKYNGGEEIEAYLDKELLECYLAMAPVIKKQIAIRAEAETKRLKDAGLI